MFYKRQDCTEKKKTLNKETYPLKKMSLNKILKYLPTLPDSVQSYHLK